MSVRTTWAVAIVVGLLLASAVTIPQASDVARRARQHALTFDVQVSKPTTMEVFFDLGAGFRPSSSVQMAVAPSDLPVTHHLPLGPGIYWAIRFDPFGEDGTFTLRNARITERNGRTVANLSPGRFQPSEFVHIDARTDDGLIATALSGHGDPRLSYPFRPPLVLLLSRAELLYWGGVFYVVALLGTLGARLVPMFSHMPAHAPTRVATRPGLAIGATAAIATLVAVYPLFLGHSLATPNNGPSTFVYDRPPFVPGSGDLVIENGRLADTNATMWVTLPYTRVQRDAVLAGEFPWWNRRAEGGVPLWGQGQSRFLDPIHWPGLIDDVALGADISFIAGRMVFALGAGLAAWAASGSVSAAVVIALAAPFVGVFAARLNDPGYFCIVYAPWILWGYGLLSRAAARPAAASASVVIAIGTALTMFASPPKEGVLVLCGAHVAGLVALLRPAAVRVAGPGRGPRVIWAGAALVAAALLTTPHWLIFLETLSNALTVYEGGVIEFAGLPQLASFAIATLAQAVDHAGLNLLVVALLAVAVVECRRVVESPLALGSAVAALAGLALAMGVVPGEWLARVPLVPQIHHLGRSTFVAIVPLLLTAAAPGIASLWDRAPGSSMWRASTASVLAGLVAFAAVLTASDLTQPAVDAGLVVAAWAGTWPFLFRTASAGGGGVLAWIALVSVTAVLLLPGGLHLRTGQQFLDQVLVQPRQRVALDVRPPEFESMAEGDEPYRVAGTNRVLSGAVPAYLGLETITGFEALASPYSRWLGISFAPAFPPVLPAEDADSTTDVGPLLDLWGVRYQMAAPDTAAGRPLVVNERSTAWPRAYFVDRVEAYDRRQAFADRLRAATGPLAAIDRADAQADAATRAFRGEATVLVSATDYRLTPNTTTFTVHAPRAGTVVLTEAFWPGVSATINGQPADVYRVNEAMRGVTVDGPGRWAVRFSYRPRYFSTAAWMAAAGAALLATLAALAIRGR